MWLCIDTKGRVTTRGEYLDGLKKRVSESWMEEGSVSEKWEVLKSAICDEAQKVLGYEDRRQPDWFRESEIALKPLLQERNRLYALWLSTGRERDGRSMQKRAGMQGDR